MRRALAVAALAAVAGALAACSGHSAEATATASAGDSLGARLRPIAVGDAVPPYAAALVSAKPGDSVHVGGAQPGVTLVNVWATWCTSCREELALLDSLQRENAALGLRVVAVSVDEGSTDRVARFIAGQHVSFAVAHDPESRIQRDYAVVGVPETFLVGRDGRLLWSYVGELPDSARTVVARALRGS